MPATLSKQIARSAELIERLAECDVLTFVRYQFCCAATGAFHDSAGIDGFSDDATVIGLKASLARLEYISPILVA
jgi:hypothetical protein